ncbi:MAG: preprotein translocase subunit SecG [Candidatus Nealsonbacteria bacterium RIFOXYB1_FULL_40_15]|uniref:Protein-export membrane protein SecG n=2 Tax=Candidatus Nealsoniibacteriota TaxID=1817911 RepID=A0A1G2EQY1_9BACT|nr:MAG: preprotein translocase subunit SecG [Candidatus Nealsonbacteria bacterium RIFOXYB1_FULL_40_15]OGZ28203.1 MAG: preprotein translocase subunit SecG [Candidatus Nealsonbacteria bacterium RIFOXYC1_FULL_40_7]OGZ28735.1 MAG: preprotein translocase subunit SecG [Candidatus Nealsonbacteria bacterium RIFOXYD1_FULL_39_11]
MENLTQISQIVVSVLLIAFVLLQQRGTALGSSFGGEGGGFYSTRRGIQQKIYWATIISAIIFIILAVSNLII